MLVKSGILHKQKSRNLTTKGSRDLSLGGEGGIRTLAQVAPPKALAKPPLRPLGYISMPNYNSAFALTSVDYSIFFLIVHYLKNMSAKDTLPF